MKLSFWRHVSAIFLAVLLAVSTPVLAVSETMDDAVVNTVAPSAAPVETAVPEETEAPAKLDETNDSPTPGTDDTVTPSPDPSITYKLTFNGNGAKLTTAIAGNYTSKTLYAAGTEVNLTTALDGKKFAMTLSADYSTNYRQLGWNTAKDGSGTHYDMGATFVMPEGDTTLYAEWESYEWLHWEAVLAEGGESITIHEGVTGKTEKTSASFKLFTGNSGNQYGKVPAAYYTPVVATAKAGYLFTGWYDGETLVSESNTLTTQDFRNLRALKFAESGAKLEARFEKFPTITYTDGVGGKAFADQVYYVKVGEATPAFNGTPTRANCEFTGWTPEVAETVTGDATYAATWKVLEPAVPSGSNSSKELFKFHCTTDSEAHVDQTYNWFGSYVKYNGDMAFDEARGVYTATANITNVQTLLSSGTKAPNKVWGTTHYHTDENGNKVMTAAIKLVWNPDAGLWEPDGEQLVNVWHATAPAAPTLAGLPRSTKSSTAIRVQNASVPFSASNTRDSVDSNVHYFRDLKEGTYEFSEVTKDENGDFWCTLKITDFAPYVATFNTRNSHPTPAFSIDTEKTTANFTWKLKYTGSKTDYKTDGTGWSIDSSSWAKGETPRTGKLLYVDQFYTVTYTDGANGEAFADQVTKVKANAATPAFNGTPTREGYVFNGWTPEVAEKVYANVTYTATWAEDKNGNGVADDKDPHYTVTYTDGVEDEVVFEDETYADQLVGMPTPAFSGDTTRKGYVFKGWNPAVTDAVTDEVTYVAVWGVDKNNNSIDDADETHYTVTYTDGVEKKEIFADQVYEGLIVGEATPAFNGTPTRKGYKFGGWEPKVAETVTDNAVYTAKWIKIEDTDDVPKTGDFATAPAALLASSLTFLVSAWFCRSKAARQRRTTTNHP